jgi:hypothetical protein
MIREKRLSPRRAKSFLRSKGGTPSRASLAFTSHRFRRKAAHQYARRLASAPFQSTPAFDARPESFRGSVPLSGMSSLSHGAAPAQEYRLRLKQIPPNASRRCPPLKSSTPCSGLLLLRLFAHVLKRQLTFPFWKQKLRLDSFFSPKRNPKDSWREGRERRPMAQPKR